MDIQEINRLLLISIARVIISCIPYAIFVMLTIGQSNFLVYHGTSNASMRTMFVVSALIASAIGAMPFKTGIAARLVGIVITTLLLVVITAALGIFAG